MKTKNLVILMAIVVAFAAYVFLFERHRPTTEEAAKEAEKVLRDFDRDDVTGIVIDGAKGRVRLEKVGEDWRLREPLDFPAESSAVSSTLGSLANLTADRRLPADEADPAAYGLDKPEAEIRLQMNDGGERVVAVGNELPLGSKRGLRLDGGDEVIIAPGWFVSDVERDVGDWRSHDVVDISEDDVASIEIEAGSDRIRAVRLRKRWKLLEPLEDLADGDHLRGLVSDLASMRIKEFLDNASDPEKLGLETPEYEITIIRSDGGEPFTLALGATRDGDGGAEVACRRGDGEYFWASERVRSRLAKAPVLWRSKKVMPFETWNLATLRLSGEDNSVELDHESGIWRFAEDGAEADQAAVRDRLSKLAGLEATDYDLMAPMTDQMGRAEVVMKGDDKTDGETIVFTFYSPLEKGGRVIVRVTGRDTIMGVEADDASAIVGDLQGLRPTPPEEPAADSE